MGVEQKCSKCLKKVSEIAKTYYEIWEKKKEDFGLGRKEETFCENCWKGQEKNYRNYPLDTDQVKRRITKQEIIEATSNNWESRGIESITTRIRDERRKNRLPSNLKINLLERKTAKIANE